MLYKYVATDVKTGIHKAEITEAESMADLMDRLKKQGLKNIRAQKVSEKRTGPRRFSLRRHVSRKEVKVFTRQMAATLGAGFLLTEALESVAEDLENVYFSEIIKNVHNDVKSGIEFSKALSRYPRIFPSHYTSIVKAGEATGWLNKTLADLAKYLEDSERLREKVKTSLSYPVFVLCFAVFMVMMIVLFIIPRFRQMFDDLGAELPAMTQLVVNVSEFLYHYSWAIFSGTVVLMILFSLSMRVYGFRAKRDMLVLKIPVLGREIILKGLVSRFCRTLGFLLNGGVPISQALKITEDVVGHIPMAKCVDEINSHVVAGGMISDKVRQQKIFPNMVYKMISLGEKSGKLNEMLLRTANYYEEEIEFALQRLTAMLEPALIIIVGGIVFVVVVALYMPIFSISQMIR